jgi:acyl-CoA thioesterase-1
MSAPAARNWSRRIANAVAAVAVSSLLTAVALTSAAGVRSTTTGLSTASSLSGTPSAAPAPVAAPPTQVLTIGDSIMKGFGLTPADAWPELISAANGWSLTTLACDGAGFLTPGSPDECGDNFVDVSRSAAILHPDLIIIEGSSNDFGRPNTELLSATLSALAILRSEFPNAEIIGLSTVWSDTTPPDQLAEISSQVQQAVTAVGGHYLDIGQPLGAHPELMQDDDVHPTVAGQQHLATAIQAAIAAEQQEITRQEAIVAHQLVTAQYRGLSRLAV